MKFREVVHVDKEPLFSAGSVEHKIRTQFPSAVITPSKEHLNAFDVEAEVDDLEFYMFMVDINALSKCINLRKEFEAGTNKEMVRRLTNYKHRAPEDRTPKIYVTDTPKGIAIAIQPQLPVKVNLKVEGKDAERKARRKMKRAERKRRRLEQGN